MKSKNSSNQNGFGAIEAILVIIIVILIIAVGWYAWHVKQPKVSTATSASTAVVKKSANQTTSTEPQANSKQPQATNTIVIKELGVTLVNVPSNLSDLTYSTRDSTFGNGTPGTVAQFSTTSLTAADSTCSASQGSSIGILARVDGVYDANAYTAEDGQLVKQFNGFWISYAHPQAACSNNSSAESIHVAQTASFQVFATNPSNITAL